MENNQLQASAYEAPVCGFKCFPSNKIIWDFSNNSISCEEVKVNSSKITFIFDRCVLGSGRWGAGGARLDLENRRRG